MSILDRYGGAFDGSISPISQEEIDQPEGDWKFDWLKIYRDGDLTFKVALRTKIQGLLKLEWENDEYVIMKNVEVSPSNFGSAGQFLNVADLLISYACYLSFILNKVNYTGYLAFTGKGVLMKYYEEKYGRKPSSGTEWS